MMASNHLQESLLQEVLRRFPTKHDAVEVLSEILSVGKDGIYRRLRGDTLLTPDEVKLLAQKFQISLDAIIYKESNSILFTYNLFTKKIQNFTDYIEQVYENQLTASSIEGVSIYYASQELPIFLYYYYPELLSFKFYIYGLTTWNFEFLQDRKFSRSLLPPEVVEKALEFVRLYSLIPSKDLWNLNFVDSTLNQIEFMATIELFEDPEDALLLCDQVSALLKRAKKMAKLGRKFFKTHKTHEDYGAFELYHNELVNTNNTILVRSPVGKIVYTTVKNPNFLKSMDEKFTQTIENWFDMIISRSTSISVHSSKSRNWFFNRLKKKVQAARSRIEMLTSSEMY